MRIMESELQVLSMSHPQPEGGTALPHFLTPVSAGFPSPAEDYVDTRLDLNHLLIRHPSTTFLVTVTGESMKDANIHSGDILVVDRSIPAAHGRIVIAALDGELVVKRFVVERGVIVLASENPAYQGIRVPDEEELKIWGVVTAVIHRF